MSAVPPPPEGVARRRRPVYFLEYLALRMALWAIEHIPTACVQPICRVLGSLSFILLRKRRKTAVDNILKCGIESTADDAAALARRSFIWFATMVIESLRAERLITEANWQEHVTDETDPEVMALLREPGQGLLVTSAHIGSWEVAAQILSYIKPVVAIARTMKNPYTNQLILSRKAQFRFKMTPKNDTGIGRLVSVLREGDLLVILMDQHARDRGMILDVLGRPASVHTSPALLHLVTRTPVCFGYLIRTGPMQYTMRSSGLITHAATGNKDDDMRAVLTKLNAEIEKAIRAYPEQYLWSHRRWRVDDAHDVRA